MGNSPVGNTATKNLTVKNTGTNPLFIGNVTSNDPEFATTGATTCPPGGLAHLASCTIAIGFTPSSLGAHSATLQVNDNTATSPQHVRERTPSITAGTAGARNRVESPSHFTGLGVKRNDETSLLVFLGSITVATAHPL